MAFETLDSIDISEVAVDASSGLADGFYFVDKIGVNYVYAQRASAPADLNDYLLGRGAIHFTVGGGAHPFWVRTPAGTGALGLARTQSN